MTSWFMVHIRFMHEDEEIIHSIIFTALFIGNHIPLVTFIIVLIWPIIAMIMDYKDTTRLRYTYNDILTVKDLFSTQSCDW